MTNQVRELQAQAVRELARDGVLVRAWTDHRTEDTSAVASFVSSDHALSYALGLNRSGEYARITMQADGSREVVLVNRRLS